MVSSEQIFEFMKKHFENSREKKDTWYSEGLPEALGKAIEIEGHMEMQKRGLEANEKMMELQARLYGPPQPAVSPFTPLSN